MTSNESTGVSQTIKNSLYVSDIDDIDTGLYEEKFVLLNQYISEVDDNLIYGSSVMNLFWGLFNGINSEQQAQDFLELHHKVRLDKDLVNNEGDNYKWACGGLGGKNVEFRMIVLPQIVSGNYPTYSNVEV